MSAMEKQRLAVREKEKGNEVTCCSVYLLLG